ncbi:uncharacterized protein LOC121405378 [Drosophila obscura]|uniref:uncharacterized protein LOC121405378 n=1 Tax=Drosophila obscura TaxID=7282 RepID=UPI001BB19683|nr:uncharacterized protein LOC121405378 [Drosophila obscura]
MEKLTKEKYEELRLLCDTVGAQQLADCLVDVLINNDDYLPRRDEAMLVVAVYLSTCTNQLERALFRKYFPRLVRTDTELFIFTGLVNQVQDLRGRKTPLSRTIRKAVIEWYTDKSAAVLLQMWSKGEQICASHKNLLHICHYRDVELIPEIKATLELFCTPTRQLGNWPEFLNPLIGSKKIIEGIVKLRKAINALEALPILKELSLTYEQAPENFRADPVLAEYLIPTISYEQLLKTSPRVLRLCKRGQHRPAAHPAMIAVKRNRPNFLFNVYASSFGHNKALGKRLHITLSLEKFYLGKYLNDRYRSINYLDALVGVAFGYYKTDSDGSKVNYWSDRTGKLKTLPWTNAMTVVEATECCKTQGVQKTKQVLTQILNKAMEDTKTYDVFLIVVPAATRGNPFNSSNTLSNLLKLYREERKCNAK